MDAFYTAYLDDIVIYSKTLEEHRAHVKKVLEALSKVSLHLKPEKSEFHKTEVKYLGLIISADSVKSGSENSQSCSRVGFAKEPS